MRAPAAVASPLLAEQFLEKRPGIGVSDLSDDGKADPPDLVDMPSRKRALAEGAIDSLRAKFGGKAVETGYTFGRSSRGRPPRATGG